MNILIALRTDLACGISLLTRLPVAWLIQTPNNQHKKTLHFARSLWAWPLLGTCIGGFTGGILSTLEMIHVPPPVAACCAIAAQTFLTGALHEDGLADMADGFGGKTPEQRLMIMRDSHICAEIAERIITGHLSAVGSGDRCHRLKHVRMRSDDDVRAPVRNLLCQVFLARNRTKMVFLAPVRQYDHHVRDLLRFFYLIFYRSDAFSYPIL